MAEGILPIERLLVITFTRMATGELRERVRERLVRTYDGLVDVLGAERGHEDDELVRLLADAPAEEVAVRRDRLGKAIANFDAATIETTHGFCLQVLYGLGTAGDVDREVTLVEDVNDLMEEVVDDLFLRKFATRTNSLKFTRAEAMQIARHALDHPDAELVPPLSQQQDTPSLRRRFAEAARDDMKTRKRTRKILTYDDVLLRLRHTLADPERGPAACARLRERFDVVLVDEFQDTDPVQWEIMARAFGEGSSTTLVLIGDPKQAIYAFRGADVHAYLLAHQAVQSEWTLDVNWRSDQALLGAYDALFGDAHLGYADIAYRPIRAAEANQRSRLVGAPEPTPLRLRIVHAADGLVPLTPKQGLVSKAEARNVIATDLAADVVAFLSARPKLIVRGRDGRELEHVDVHPGHIAVLVRLNSHAALVRDALHAVSVPAVIGGSGSVFATDPAKEWLRLLEALERPTARDRAVAGRVRPASSAGRHTRWRRQSEESWEGLHWSLHRWAALLRDQGIAALFERVSSSQAVPRRVLTRASGERFMTDLRHVAQLLHEAGVSEGLGPTALATWLGRRIHDVERDGESEERARRLESDADAVQVITIHRSKGLEFPIVYCPFAWDGYAKPRDVPMFHDPTNANKRTIDVGHQGNDFARHQKMEIEEGRGEDLRLLYVALDAGPAPGGALVGRRLRQPTLAPGALALRPRCQRPRPALWCGSSAATRPSRPPGAGARAARGGGAGRSTFVRTVASAGRTGSRARGGALCPAPRRRMATRASYSSITRAAHEHPAIGSEPEPGLALTSDEVDVPQQARPGAGAGDDAADPTQSIDLGLSAMPGGALVGTVVHSVFERTDFDAPDLAASVREALDPRDDMAQRGRGEHRCGGQRPLRCHRVATRSPGRRGCVARRGTQGQDRRARLRDPARRGRRADDHPARGGPGRSPRDTSAGGGPGGPLRGATA